MLTTTISTVVFDRKGRSR